jgi:hypothetical protein
VRPIGSKMKKHPLRSRSIPRLRTGSTAGAGPDAD